MHEGVYQFMAKRELIANDPMEVKLMSICGTVSKIATFIIIVLLALGVVFGIVLSGVFSEIGGFLVFLVGFLPNAMIALVVWLIKTLLCLWLEYQTEMHCYARTQTEILMENSGKE